MGDDASMMLGRSTEHVSGHWHWPMATVQSIYGYWCLVIPVLSPSSHLFPSL